MVPTLWIVLGPLGQSITAASLLGGAARLALPPPYGTGVPGVRRRLRRPGLGLRRAVGGAGHRAHGARRPAAAPVQPDLVVVHVPGRHAGDRHHALALHTGADAFRWAAAGLYLVLVAAWLVVSVRTVRGAWRGGLLRRRRRVRPCRGGRSRGRRQMR